MSFVLLHRLRGWGQPFLAFHPGLLRDTLAYHGCAELFQVSCLSPFLLSIGSSFMYHCRESRCPSNYSQVKASHVLFKLFIVVVASKFNKKSIVWTFFKGIFFFNVFTMHLYLNYNSEKLNNVFIHFSIFPQLSC